MKNKGIIAYGNEQDRAKLAVLARADHRTASSWLIEKIRTEYARQFGEHPPEDFLQ